MRRWWLAAVVCLGVSGAAPALGPQQANAWWADEKLEKRPVEADPEGPFYTSQDPGVFDASDSDELAPESLDMGSLAIIVNAALAIVGL